MGGLGSLGSLREARLSAIPCSAFRLYQRTALKPPEASRTPLAGSESAKWEPPRTDITHVECAKTATDVGGGGAEGTEGYRREHLGSGDWEAWGTQLGPLEQAISDWREQLSGIHRPWLCWYVFDRFCRIQQRLALEFGWTPVVGADPRAEEPTVLPGSVRFDANRLLSLPTMWFYFPFEFVYAIAPRMAVWHSDLLVSRRDMECLVRVFDSLKDGELAAVAPQAHWFSRTNRCPALAACTTRGGSQDLWDHGCGWWRWFPKHPNFRGRFRARGNNWEHGRGIWYWQQHYGGTVRTVSPDERGHCNTRWGLWKGTMTKAEAIARFHDIDELVRKLQLTDLDDGEKRDRSNFLAS